LIRGERDQETDGQHVIVKTKVNTIQKSRRSGKKGLPGPSPGDDLKGGAAGRKIKGERKRSKHVKTNAKSKRGGFLQNDYQSGVDKGEKSGQTGMERKTSSENWQNYSGGRRGWGTKEGGVVGEGAKTLV